MRNVARRHGSTRTGLAIRAVHVLTAAVVLLLVSHAQAIILHVDSDAPSESERPANNVVGRWRTNASCVAIGRADWDTTGYILTTRHQGGVVGASVWFGGVEYIVAEILDTNIPTESFGGTSYPIDMRVCRLENTVANGGGKANLTDFALWNTDTGEVEEAIVMGGYGKGRGTPGTGYYTWAASGNTTLRWGKNTVDATALNPCYVNDQLRYVSQTLRIDFDGTASHDAAIAEYDSGGGWFYQDGGNWVVAGLSAYATTFGKSYYSPSDSNWAIRVSSYASWINSLLGEHYEPSILGDADLDGDVDLDDLGILADNWNSTSATWYMGDFNFDGDVDLDDLGILADHWGGSVSSGVPVNPVPEPTSLSLLVLGVMPLLKRRSR